MGWDGDTEVGWDGEGVVSEGTSLLSYTLRYVSLTEVDTVCQFGLREPMHLCACVSEEGGDGEGMILLKRFVYYESMKRKLI